MRQQRKSSLLLGMKLALAEKDVLPYSDGVGSVCPGKHMTRCIVMNANRLSARPDEAA
jgi:hypothetical protein